MQSIVLEGEAAKVLSDISLSGFLYTTVSPVALLKYFTYVITSRLSFSDIYSISNFGIYVPVYSFNKSKVTVFRPRFHLKKNIPF